MLRNYATAATKRPSRLKKPTVSLDHFIQRQRVIALWRNIVKDSARIQDVSTRNEIRQFARGEFEQHRNVTDLTHIRYLISSGKTQFDAMKTSLENSGMMS